MVHKNSLLRRMIVVVCALAICLLMNVTIQAAAQDLVIVANKALGADSISTSDLKDIFLGNMTSLNTGEKVGFVVFDDPDAQEKFMKQYIKKTPSQFNNYWRRMVFTGKAAMPRFLKTPEEVIRFVGANPGAISFVPAPGSPAVKTLNVN